MRAPITIVLALAAGCQDHRVTFERMLSQPRVDLYMQTPAFPDGQSMRHPPPQAVPSDEPDSPLVRDGAEGGAFARTIPVPQTTATLAEGQRQFGIHCAACHGPRGDGQSYVARFMTIKRPASLVMPPVSRYPPGQIFDRISRGFKNMRSYRELSISDRWAVVQYVKWLQSSQTEAGVSP